MNERPLRDNRKNKRDKENKTASEYYHHARRSLILISSILFGFSLAGLKITQDNSQQLAVEFSKYTDIKLSFSNPELLPYILVIIIIYLIYRLNIEWYHCSINIREFRVSRIDYIVSLSIGMLSILAFLVQTLTKIKLADVFEINMMQTIIISIFLGITVGLIIRLIKRRRLYNKIIPNIILLSLIGGSLTILSIFTIRHTNYMVIASTIFMIIILGIALFFTNKKVNRYLDNKTPSIRMFLNRVQLFFDQL